MSKQQRKKTTLPVQDSPKIKADKPKPKMEVIIKHPGMFQMVLGYSKWFIAAAFTDCLRKRQASIEVILEENKKTSKKKNRRGVEEKQIYNFPQIIIPQFNLSELIQNNFAGLLTQLRVNGTLLLVLASLPLVNGQCPDPYACPAPMLPLPTAQNNCSVIPFVQVFNNTFIFNCSLMFNLTKSAASSLFKTACENCMADTTPPTIINNCVTALFYANDTLCYMPPPDPPIIDGPGFDYRWLYILLVLVPITGCIATLWWYVRSNTKNINIHSSMIAEGAAERAEDKLDAVRGGQRPDAPLAGAGDPPDYRAANMEM